MKILIVGYGSIGKRHFLNFKKYSDVKVLELKTKNTENIFFKNIKEALKWNPDGVVICTPTHTHLEVAKKFLGIKSQLLIEKPLIHKSSLIERFKKNKNFDNKNISVVNNMRFHKGILTIKKNIGKIGKIFFARAHFGNWLPNMRPKVDYRMVYSANKKYGGGVILDSIHEIDYLSSIFGEIKKISLLKRKLSRLQIDVEDFATMVIQHEDKIISELHLDFLRPVKKRGCEVVGDKGTLIWESLGKKPEKCEVKFCKKGDFRFSTIYSNKNLDINLSYDLMAKEFVKKIQNKKQINLLSFGEACNQLIKIEKSKIIG